MKKLLFLFPVFCFGMENVCHLALLPTDIKNVIAEYLPFADRESDREAKGRNEVSKINSLLPHEGQDKESDELWKQYPVDTFKHYVRYRADRKFFLHNQNKSLLITIDCGYWGDREKDCPKPFALFDAKTNRKILESCFLHKDTIRHAAISNDGKHCAFITEKHDNYHSHDEAMRSPKFTLTVKNLETQDIVFHLSEAPPIYTSIDSIHFNKQSTKVIVKGWGDFPNNLPAREDGFLPEENFKHVDLFQITSDTEDKEKSKKTLALYLYQKAICKQLQSNVL